MNNHNFDINDPLYYPTQLLIVDPQNDFCDPSGSLHVIGAYEDMARGAEFIKNHIDKISKIYVTLDNHSVNSIFHTNFWVDAAGNHPEPFTQLIVFNGNIVSARSQHVYKPNQKLFKMFDYSTIFKRCYQYISELNRIGKQLSIWPFHCIQGSWGASVCPTISNALLEWSEKTGENVEFVTKGERTMIEQYSAFSIYMLEANGLEKLTKNGNIVSQLCNSMYSTVIFGEALSHCVKETTLDLIEHKKDNIKIFSDCCSSVDGFAKESNEFLKTVNHCASIDYFSKG